MIDTVLFIFWSDQGTLKKYLVTLSCVCDRFFVGSYVVGYQTGKLLYVSGHIPMTPEGVLLTGTVRKNLGYQCAKTIYCGFW